MEVVAGEMGDEMQSDEDFLDNPFGAREARQKDLEAEKEQNQLLRTMSQRLEKMEQKMDDQDQVPAQRPPSCGVGVGARVLAWVDDSGGAQANAPG